MHFPLLLFERMNERLLSMIRCPVTRAELQLNVLSTKEKAYLQKTEFIVDEGILFTDDGWFYPIIRGIPRLLVEAFIDYNDFFEKHLPGYTEKKEKLLHDHGALIHYSITKNKHTKESFSREWSIHDHSGDKTWNENAEGMLDRFFKETGEDIQSIKGKWVFDAGCGNGLLDHSIAANGATVVAMDFSNSIEKAFELNNNPDCFFIQGDVQYPPVAFECFDLVHCSGVLIHTNNTEHSFSCLVPCVKPGGKLSVWLYHPRKNFVHNLFNFIRRFTSRLPLKVQYNLYRATLFPASYVIKKIKGSKQNKREMMIDILDWFSPQYRWEHTHAEVTGWFEKYHFTGATITTTNIFGFNMTGIKPPIKRS
jgi:uncharacterized protein YbaR (Trm112 family)/SAM-dependent methyltransferase